MATTQVFTIPTAGEGRLIEHFGDSVVQSTLRERVGRSEFYRAVGYLSTWNMTYPHVKLYYNARELEITASYYNEAGELGYCVGAVFNDTSKQFGFHS